MTATGPTADAGRTLPAEVADARRTLGLLTARHLPGAEEIAVLEVPRPVVALVGAPGRGRHALAAALLGLDGGDTTDPSGAPVRRWVHTTTADGGTVAGGSAVPVPLLEELDLHLPARGPGGRAAVGAASAVLLLADAAAPLDRAELSTLAELAGTVEVVVPVLGRVEAHRGWRTVLEADRALLAEAVPRLAGAVWFPVSVELARRAAADHPGVPAETAEALRRASGIAPLQRALHGLVARRARMLAETNALRRAATAAGRLPAVPVPRRAPSPGGAVAAADRRRRHVHWRAGLATARIAALDDLRTRIHRLGLDTRRHVDRAPRAELAALPERLAGELETLAGDTVAALDAELGRLVAETLAGLAGPGELADLHLADLRPPEAPPAPPARAGPPEDRLLLVAGASGGLGLSRLALLPLVAAPVVPAVLGVALLPVSVGLGVGAAAWLVHARRSAADRAHLRQWAADALTTVRADLERVLAEAVVVAEREVTLALDAALDRAPGATPTTPTAVPVEAREALVRAEALLGRVRAVLRRDDAIAPSDLADRPPRAAPRS